MIFNILRRGAIAAALIATSIASASAQSQADIAAQIATQVPDNGRGAITASGLRGVLNSLNGSLGSVTQALGQPSGIATLGPDGTLLPAQFPVGNLLPRVANNAALAAYGPAGVTVFRDGYAVTGDSPPMAFHRSSAACSINGGLGDGGSQVPSIGGGCWVAQPDPMGWDARQFGVDLTGTNDSTAALNACLSAALYGKCNVPLPGRVRLTSGDIKLGPETTLRCTTTKQSNSALFSGYPTTGLLLNPAHSFLATGNDATIEDCTIVPYGMAFPQPGASSSTWLGTAFKSQSNTAPVLKMVTIAGFDSCFDLRRSLRPSVSGDYDCNGGINAGTASGVWGNPGDTGYIDGVKFQAFATASSCPARLRNGIGMLIDHDAGQFWRDVTVQDFDAYQVWFNYSAVQMIGNLWADYWTQGPSAGSTDARCTSNTAQGVLSTASTAIHIDHLNLNGSNTGLNSVNSSKQATFYVGDLFYNNTYGDAVKIGQASGGNTSGGTVTINHIRTNQTALGVNKGFATNFLDPNGTSMLIINSASVFGAQWNGSFGVAPYFQFPSTALNQRDYKINWSQIQTDIGDQAASTGTAASGGTTTTTCTGATSCTLTGTFVTKYSADPLAGVIQLTGNGSSSSGTVTLNFPIYTSTLGCSANYRSGDNGTWGSGLTPIAVTQTSSSQVVLNFGQTAALTNGSHYNISYACRSQ